MAISTDIGVWIAAIMIIAGYSIIIKNTVVFKFAERTVLGLVAGTTAVFGFEQIIKLLWIPLTEGKIVNIIPLIIALLLFTRLSKEYAYLSRIPIIVLVASGISLGITRNVSTIIFGQIKGMLKPIPTGSTIFDIIGILIVPVVCCSVLLFFTYTREHTGALGKVSLIGRYALMFALGVSFGNFTATRTNYVILPLKRILFDWLGLVV